MKRNDFKKKLIQGIPFIISIFFTFLTAVLITEVAIYSVASSVCLEKEEVPVRWEGRGLLGVLEPIPTTEQNMDEMKVMCTKYAEAKPFSLLHNYHIILEEFHRIEEVHE
jgi:hypothetical protein